MQKNWEEVLMLESKVKWGILGCANIARGQFLPALLDCEESQLWAMASRDKPKAQAWAKEWGAEKAYGSYEELLADPLVEAVYIPLPNHLHKEWTVKALRAKKHVLCEKPMAVTVAECQEMLEVAKEEERFFMEAFMYRFHPQIETCLTWIKEGRIGEVRLVRGSFSFTLEDPENVRMQGFAGGGSLWDVGCYPIHFMNEVFGGPPQSVLAQGHFNTVDLSMTGLLNYGQGQQGVFDCSFAMAPRSAIEVVGTKGTITIPRPWRPDRQEVTLTLTVGDQSIETRFAAQNPYQLEIEHFQACIAGEAQPLLPGYLGQDVVTTVEACYQSARQGLAIQVTKMNRTKNTTNIGRG